MAYSHEIDPRYIPRVRHMAQVLANDPVGFIGKRRKLQPAHEVQGQPIDILTKDIFHEYLGPAIPSGKDYPDQQIMEVVRFLGFGTDDQGFMAHVFLTAYLAQPADIWNDKLVTSSQKTQEMLDYTATRSVARTHQMLESLSALHWEMEGTSNRETQDKCATAIDRVSDILRGTSSHRKSEGRKTLLDLLLYAANADFYPFDPAGFEEKELKELQAEADQKNERFLRRAEKARLALYMFEVIPNLQNWKWLFQADTRESVNLLLHTTHGDTTSIPEIPLASKDTHVTVDQLLIHPSPLSEIKASLWSKLQHHDGELKLHIVPCPDNKHRTLYDIIMRRLLHQQKTAVKPTHHLLPLPDKHALLIIRTPDNDQESNIAHRYLIGLALQRFLVEHGIESIPPEILEAMYIANEIQEQDNWEIKAQQLHQKIISGLNAIGKRGIKINLRRHEDEIITSLGITSITIKKRVSADNWPLGYSVRMTVLGKPVDFTLNNDYQIEDSSVFPAQAAPFFTALVYAYIAVFKNPEQREEIELFGSSPVITNHYDEKDESTPKRTLPRTSWHPSRLVKFMAGQISHKLNRGSAAQKAVSTEVYDRTAEMCRTDFGADLQTLNRYFEYAQQNNFAEIPAEFHVLMNTLLERRTAYDLEQVAQGTLCQLGYIEEVDFEGYQPVSVTCKGAAQLLFASNAA